MRLLFIDTETTGKPRRYTAPTADADNWPRLVEVCWLVGFEGHGATVMSDPVCHVIRPDGWEIPAGAALIHGITTEMAREIGKPLSEVLDALEITVLAADRIVAHNTDFDVRVLGAEFLRAGRRDPLAGKPATCTMRSLTDWCKIPGPYGYKWPTLQELHEKLFGSGFGDAHRAETDVLACARCYREARARGIL